MTADRRVDLVRNSRLQFTATNARGGTLSFGSGDHGEFTPVELLLAAIAGCTGMDVDAITSKRAEADRFELTATADKVRDEHGNHLTNIMINFEVSFPDGESGDAAEAVLPIAIQKSHDRLCTVTRTVELPTTVTSTLRSVTVEKVD
jgi:putative redox protein